MTGYRYIGKTLNNFGDRWDHHKALLRHNNHSNIGLQSDWYTYGEDSFKFNVLFNSNDLYAVNEMEEYYITSSKLNNICYNILIGGDTGRKGLPLSEKAKQLIGEKNRINMTGRKASDETKAKMSASQFERYKNWSEEQRVAFGKMISDRTRGHHWQDEAKQRFAELQRQKPNSAKYTPDDIRTIRRKYEAGVSKQALANEYNTSPAYINSIIKRRRWKYID